MNPEHDTEDDHNPRLHHGRGDRILLVVVGLLISFFIGIVFISIPRWQPQTLASQVCRFIVLEVSSSFLILNVVVLLWATFRPKWIRKILASRANKAVATILLLFGGVLLLILYAIIQELRKII